MCNVPFLVDLTAVAHHAYNTNKYYTCAQYYVLCVVSFTNKNVSLTSLGTSTRARVRRLRRVTYKL